jgi:hypothetical protein
MISLNGVLRLIGHYSAYQDDSNTAENFQLPNNHGTFSVRTGLRYGGREPTLFPSLAMELSVWFGHWILGNILSVQDFDRVENPGPGVHSEICPRLNSILIVPARPDTFSVHD